MATKPVWTLDQIYDNFLRGGTWDPDTNFLSFSFPQSEPSGYWRVSDKEDNTFTAFTDPQVLWATRAIELWEDVIDINFIDKGHSGNADIRFMNTYSGGAGTAHAYLPGSAYHTGDIWVHADKVDNFSFWYGLPAVATLIHEIGHTLGLEHPGNYDADDDDPPTYADDASYFQDSKQYTVMSYFGAGNTGAVHDASPQTPLLHDIYVLQQRYGANLSTRTGDTTYGYNSNAGNPVYDFNINGAPVLAIWDANGTDTLDLSGSDIDQEIDLSPGRFTSALGGKDNITIAYQCWIENAKAGGGDDYIFGNIYDNSLRGNDGNDTIYGLQGDDYLVGGNGADNIYASTGEDELLGQAGNDRLYGWEGDDAMDGGSGNDYFDAWTGNDTLTGGSGNDTLSGHLGLDTFYGDEGLDLVSYAYSNASWRVDLSSDDGPAYAYAGGDAEILYSIEGAAMGGGNDTVYGTDGDNVLSGEDGNDRLYGYLGDDSLSGGAGDDLIYRGDGNNLVDGGAGNDTADYGTADGAITVRLYDTSGQRVVNLSGTADDQTDRIIGIENLKGTIFDDAIEGSTANNALTGQSGDDLLRGWNGNDNLIGGYGNDTFDGGGGNDTLNGGIGVDIASYADRWAGIAVSVADGNHAVLNAGTDHFISIDGLIGTAYGDDLDGNNGYNPLYGGDGDDEIQGLGAADFLDGEDGDDELDGGSGDDSLYGGADGDVMEGGSGNDTIYGETGDDVMAGGSGDDVIFGFEGSDTVNYAGSSGFVRVDLSILGSQDVGFTEGSDRLANIEHAVGSSLGDQLRGTDGVNQLYGLLGNDLLEGRGGTDLLDGNMGSDTASYESAASGVQANLANPNHQNTGGGGIDRFVSIENLKGSAYNDILMGDLVGNHLQGLDGDDWLLGGLGDDWMGGGDGDDIVFGDAGDDIMTGEDGNDTASYVAATAGVAVSIATHSLQDLGVMGTDRLYFFENLSGSQFNDSLTGDLWGNILEGKAGNDSIMGAGGADTIDGGDGADLLKAGTGQDRLTGGDGADIFAYLALAESAEDIDLADVIVDYAAGEDAISLSAIDAQTNVDGHQSFTFIGGMAFSAAGQVRFQQSAAHDWTVVSLNVVGSSGAEMRIKLDGLLDLTAADFLL